MKGAIAAAEAMISWLRMPSDGEHVDTVEAQ